MQIVDASTGDHTTADTAADADGRDARSFLRLPSLPAWCLVLIILVCAVATSALLPD